MNKFSLKVFNIFFLKSKKNLVWLHLWDEYAVIASHQHGTGCHFAYQRQKQELFMAKNLMLDYIYYVIYDVPRQALQQRQRAQTRSFDVIYRLLITITKWGFRMWSAWTAAPMSSATPIIPHSKYLSLSTYLINLLNRSRLKHLFRSENILDGIFDVLAMNNTRIGEGLLAERIWENKES